MHWKNVPAPQQLLDIQYKTKIIQMQAKHLDISWNKWKKALVSKHLSSQDSTLSVTSHLTALLHVAW